MGKFLFTSESVTEGHPDKACDAFSDAILDSILTQDNESHVACESLATKGLVVISGEVRTNANIDTEQVVKDTIKEIGYNKGVKKIVLDQARLAKKAKLDAIVCSAQEVKIVKKVFKKEIITPGIRFNSKPNDQIRTLTPKQAYKNGSDWLVIGRPITKGNIKKNMQTLIDHLSQ